MLTYTDKLRFFSSAHLPRPFHVHLLCGLFLVAMSVVWTGCTEDPAPSMPMDEMDMMVDMELPDVGTTADERCEDARSSDMVLVLFADRVEGMKRNQADGNKLDYVCTVLALHEQGIRNAKAITLAPDGNLWVVQTEDLPVENEGDEVVEGGAVYIYSANGDFERKVDPHPNLKGVAQIWTLNEDVIVWSERTSNLYKLNADGTMGGSYPLPGQSSARITNLTDLLYLEMDDENGPRLAATFSDRPPQVFAFPNNSSIK